MKRTATINQQAIDVENRTVEIAFSSDTPVRQMFGFEVLDHRRDGVDLSDLNEGAPLLNQHDWNEQIGVVSVARVDSQKVGRATVKFSRSQKAEEIFQDVIDGIRTKISVGYMIEDAEQIEDIDQTPAYRVKWKPYEISFVSVPADNTVGVGRDANIESVELLAESEIETVSDEPEEVAEVDATDTGSEETAEVEEETTESEAEETAEDNAEPEAEETQPNEVEQPQPQRSAAIIKPQKETKTMPENNIIVDPVAELETSERRQYSLMNVIRSMSSGDQSKIGFELEVNQELERREGREARGILVPLSVLNRDKGESMGKVKPTAHANPNISPDDWRPSDLIEMLREKTIAGQLGARFLTGLRGDVYIPKKLTGGNYHWLDETDDVTESQITFGNVKLSPKTCAGAIPMTRRLMLQSDPSVEALVRAEIMEGLALTIDQAVFNGAGTQQSNEPKGILNQTGILKPTAHAALATNNPNFADYVAMETAMDIGKKGISGSPKYVMSRDWYGAAKTEMVAPGIGERILENNVINGYDVVRTGHFASKTVLLGDFSDVLIGNWSSIDLMADEYAYAASGGLVIRAFVDMDVAIRHPESFVLMDATTKAATP